MAHLYFEHAFSGGILSAEVVLLILSYAFVSYLMAGIKEHLTLLYLT